jgi:predicted transcriptional regulator
MITAIRTYEDVQEKINRIFRSGLQIRILISLGEGTKTLSDLRDITGSSSQAILPIIRKMESEHLILSLRTEYSLTPTGKIVYSKVYDCVYTFGILKNQHDFWLDHFLEGIPTEFLDTIGNLRDSKIIKDTNAEIFQTYALFLNTVKKARHIYWITPIMSPGHADAIFCRVPEKIPAELIITPDVAAQLVSEPFKEKMKSLEQYQNFSVSVVAEPIKLGLLHTDTSVSLGLYKKDGITFDPYTELISSDASALSWGYEIFQYYKKRSEPVLFGLGE